MKPQIWLSQLHKSLFSILLATLLTLTVPWLAFAATITVTTTTDELSAGNGNCSLREAIMNANNNNNTYSECGTGTAGLDTVNVPTGIYTLTIAGTGENLNARGDLDVVTDTAGILLNGTGPLSSSVVINANGIDRVIHAASGVALHVNNLTIRGGSVSGGLGGGASFGGTASVTGTTFLSNTTTNNGGGAYFNSTATVTGTTFSGNTASNSGGGVWFNGTATVTGTTFSGNTANSGGGASFLDTATVTGTTFSGNTANGGGGAYFQNANAKQLVNVLFARNRAGTGAAVFVDNASPLSLIHTTIVSPTAPTGGGQAVYVALGTVYLTNTIIASHTTGIEQAGGTVEENYNLLSDVPTPFVGTVGHGTNNSITGTVAFADHTTYQLSSSSAAIDVGTNLGITTDYFGGTRPQGSGYDLGYAEYLIPLPSVPLGAVGGVAMLLEPAPSSRSWGFLAMSGLMLVVGLGLWVMRKRR